MVFFDSNIFQPTAGRDSLDETSINRLTKIVRAIEQAVSPIILSSSDLLSNYIRMIPVFISQGKVEQLGKLSITTIDNKNYQLGDLKKLSIEGKRIFFSYSGSKNAASEVLSARGHIIVKLSSNSYRRQAEEQYLRNYCKGERFDNLLECLEVYTELDRFEKAVVSELDYVIRKLFNPPAFKFVTGKLSLDAPIYWTDRNDSGKRIVFIDTRHGEFQKLKSLGYSTLFTSMIEAFCREYLSDTLKRQSTKFFGSGAVNFDALSRSHAELWELLASDIETSTIYAPKDSSGVQPRPGDRGRGSRISIVRSTDIAQVTITADSGVKEAQETEGLTQNQSGAGPKVSPKILRIIDETSSTGLNGYYMKIPQSASEAFGDILKTFPTFAVVWFANRVTWQLSDLKNSAFLFDVTLDRIISSNNGKEISHGAEELNTAKLHSYSNSLYLFVPSQLEDFLIPKDNKNAIKIEIRHELVDIEGARAWTSKDAQD